MIGRHFVSIQVNSLTINRQAIKLLSVMRSYKDKPSTY